MGTMGGGGKERKRLSFLKGDVSISQMISTFKATRDHP